MATEAKCVGYLPLANAQVRSDKLRFGPLLAILVSLMLWAAIVGLVWLVIPPWWG